MKRKRCCDRCTEPDCGLGVEDTNEAMPVSVPGIFVATASSQEGKSHLLSYLAYINREKFDYFISVSDTGESANNLTFIPLEMRHIGWPGKVTEKAPQGESKAAIEHLIESQMKYPPRKRPLVGIAVEDNYKALRDPIFVALTTRPTHFNVWIFIAANWVNRVAPDTREGAWQVAIFEPSSEKAYKELYSSYGFDCWNYKEFMEMVKENTGNYKFMYKNLKGTKSKEGRQWKCLRAPAVIPDFTITPFKEEEEEEN